MFEILMRNLDKKPYTVWNRKETLDETWNETVNESLIETLTDTLTESQKNPEEMHMNIWSIKM